jgi:predicted CoA-substrate-specific enzyme activase
LIVIIFAGLDIGSTTGKAVLLDEDGKIIATYIMQATPNPEQTARMCLNTVLEQSGHKEEEIGFMVGTGYGRVKIPFASENISEISCHAMGAKWLCPTVRTVIDIGGQDCKAISVREDGRVKEFVMNDKCAAGTGRFMEGQARVMGVKIEDFSELYQRAKNPTSISSQCSVFAESEIISQLNKGDSISDIVAGIHASIVTRLVSLLRRVELVNDLTITGGCAKNDGLMAMLQDKAGVKIVHLPEDPQLVGALGAAVLARDRRLKKQEAA